MAPDNPAWRLLEAIGAYIDAVQARHDMPVNTAEWERISRLRCDTYRELCDRMIETEDFLRGGHALGSAPEQVSGGPFDPAPSTNQPEIK